MLYVILATSGNHGRDKVYCYRLMNEDLVFYKRLARWIQIIFYAQNNLR